MSTIHNVSYIEGKCWWCVTRKTAKDLSRPWMFFIWLCSLVKPVQAGITQWWSEASAQHIPDAVLPFLYKTPNCRTAWRKHRRRKQTSTFFSDDDSFVKEISSFCNRICSSKTGVLILNNATTSYIWWQPSKVFIRQHKSSAPSQLFTFSSWKFSIHC